MLKKTIFGKIVGKMYKWNQNLYLVSKSFKDDISINVIMSEKEVQNTIKDYYNNPYYILTINEINYVLDKQLNFKDFVPKCHQKQYKESIYRDKNIWLKIWNDIK